MKVRLHYFTFLVCFAVLTACSALKLEPIQGKVVNAQTLAQDKVINAQTAVGAAFGLLAELKGRHVINQEDGVKTFRTLSDLEAMLLIAEQSVKSGDIATAEARVAAATQSLHQINLYLQSKK